MSSARDGDRDAAEATRGVLYIAAGTKYIRAAVRSAESVRKHCPGLAIHLFVTLGLLARVMGGLGFRRFFGRLRYVMITAFSTSGSQVPSLHALRTVLTSPLYAWHASIASLALTWHAFALGPAAAVISARMSG